MSTQFDRIFEGLSQNSLSLEDACRVLYSESQASPGSMRVACERIETELSQGRITTDAAQLLLDALGEPSKEDHDPVGADEMWVDVPLEPLASEAVRPPALASRVGGDTITEVDLTMDDLLAALDRRGTPVGKPPVEREAADALAAPVEWMEWEPEEAPSAHATPAASSAAPPAADVETLLHAELDLTMAGEADTVAAAVPEAPAALGPAALESAVARPESLAEPLTEPLTDLGVAVAPAEAALPPTDVGTSETEALTISAEQSAPAADAEFAQVDDLTPVPLATHEPVMVAATAIEPIETLVTSALEVVSGEENPHPAEDSVHHIAGRLTAPAAVDSLGAATLEPASVAADEAAAGDPVIDEVFAPRVEHVLRESSPMAAGALLKDRYRIVGPLASGGLGQLFEAMDMQVAGAPRVALKLIEVDWQEEPRAFETLQAIVRHVRRLRHPNILSILDIDRDDKHVIIAMEALRGCWLSSLVREVRGRGVGYAVAWNIISGIANGLAYAHQHGAVHSELNPHMVFLTDSGQVKIVGFGLAHAMPMSTEPLTELDGQTLRSYADAYCATHWILGSIPEGVDDLYPLGVIAYELLTGAHPFNRASPATAANQHLEPLPIPGLDRRIRRVLERCLSFERKDRPATGASFLAHIEPSEKLLDLVRDRFT